MSDTTLLIKIESKAETIEKVHNFCKGRPCDGCPFNGGKECYTANLQELSDTKIMAISNTLRIIEPYIESVKNAQKNLEQVSAQLNNALKGVWEHELQHGASGQN